MKVNQSGHLLFVFCSSYDYLSNIKKHCGFIFLEESLKIPKKIMENVKKNFNLRLKIFEEAKFWDRPNFRPNVRPDQ